VRLSRLEGGSTGPSFDGDDIAGIFWSSQTSEDLMQTPAGSRCVGRSMRPGRSHVRCDQHPSGAGDAAGARACAVGSWSASVNGSAENCGPATRPRLRRGTGRATCGPSSHRPGTGLRLLRWSSAVRARRRPLAVGPRGQLRVRVLRPNVGHEFSLRVVSCERPTASQRGLTSTADHQHRAARDNVFGHHS
jgi:hypothetical protein